MRTVTFQTVADADAIKTSVASSTSEESYSGAELNGAIGAAAMVPARTLSVTTSSNTGSYNIADPITFTGTDSEGNAISEDLTLTNEDGGETLVTTKAFRTVTSIATPEQNDTGGAFTFGVRDIVPVANPPRAVRCGGAGNLKVAYDDGTTDTLTDIIAGEVLAISPTKIFGDAATTASKISLMF